MPHDLEEIPALIDLYQDTRARRLAKEKEAEAIKVLEDEAKACILATLKDSNTEAIGGTTHLAKRVVQNEPTVEDWDLVHAHIIETGHWDLMQRRISPPAVKERWDMDDVVPGVGSFPVEKLSVTKL